MNRRNQERHMHHTVSKILQNDDQIRAFKELQGTIISLHDEKIDVSDILFSLFSLGYFVAFQELRKSNASRKSYENVNRLFTDLMNPREPDDPVTLLFPDQEKS